MGLAAVLGLSASAGELPAPKGLSASDAGGLFDVGGETGRVNKLTLSGELRTRWENRQNLTDFQSGQHDRQEWVDTRARLGMRFALAEQTEVYLEAQARYLWGGQGGLNDAEDGANNVEDRDSLDVYQAYVKVKPQLFGLDTTLTVGRQELKFGKEMLLGNNSKYGGLSHDAVLLELNLIDNLSTSLFAAKVVENSVQFPENSSVLAANAGDMNDAHLFGIYNTYTFSNEAELDLYLLYVAEDDESLTAGGDPAKTGTFSWLGADAKILTFGARVSMEKLELAGQNFDFSVELAAQMGNVNLPVAMGGSADGDLDIQDSFAFEAEFGWSPGIQWNPRLAFGLAWASGDDDPTDGNINQFVPLFQDVQGRLGKADLFELSNIRCWYLTGSFNPMGSSDLTVGATYLRFEAFEEGDALGVGDAIANTAGTTANNVGDEMDLFAAYTLNKNAELKLCWSWIEPQHFISDQEFVYGNSPAHRVHLTLVVKF